MPNDYNLYGPLNNIQSLSIPSAFLHTAITIDFFFFFFSSVVAINFIIIIINIIVIIIILFIFNFIVTVGRDGGGCA
jgi:hypothetical protein